MWRVDGEVPDEVVIAVHSGSRALGEHLYWEHAARFGAQGLVGDSEDGRTYLANHTLAVNWARMNRQIVAERVADLLGGTAERVLDRCHNQVVSSRWGWLHRKGAAPADEGPVLVPGSRGHLSYLVEPNPQADWLGSIAHGAGRKWSRSEAVAKMKGRFSAEDLRRPVIDRNPAFTSQVLCSEKELLFAEAAQSYKNIDQVVAEMVQHDAVRVLGRLRPVLTFKTLQEDRS